MFKRAFNLFTLIILYLLIFLNISFGEVIKKIEILNLNKQLKEIFNCHY